MVGGQSLSCILLVPGGFRSFPMRIISRNYVTFLSYLLGQHESLTGSEKDKETKGVISWIFLS